MQYIFKLNVTRPNELSRQLHSTATVVNMCSNTDVHGLLFTSVPGLVSPDMPQFIFTAPPTSVSFNENFTGAQIRESNLIRYETANLKSDRIHMMELTEHGEEYYLIVQFVLNELWLILHYM